MKKNKKKDDFKELRIDKVIAPGEFEDLEGRTMEELLYQAGNLLDHAETSEIVGQNLFRASDGKYYTATVEVCVNVAAAWLVKEMKAQQKEAGDGG